MGDYSCKIGFTKKGGTLAVRSNNRYHQICSGLVQVFGCHPMEELLARLSSVLLKFIHFPAVVDEVPRYIFVIT